MKLDVSVLRYLSKEDFRVLTAIEMGMRNHEIVPTQLITVIAKLKRGGAFKSLSNLHKNKLIFHDAKKYDGYKLTYGGYDFLALKAFSQRATIIGVANQVGVGKESDVFVAYDPENQPVILKIHRLGRVSFRAIKEKRDYLNNRKSTSWLYLARLAALKEYAYMKVLYDNGFPVPRPIDNNRHCVIMELAKGYLLAHVVALRHPGRVYSDLMNLIVKFACYGLIHCDFNEFNIMIDEEETITVIDFPQMVSTSHENAEMYFDRDVQCIRTLFSRRYGYESTDFPKLRDYTKEFDLDVQVSASGFNSDLKAQFETLIDSDELMDNSNITERIDEDDEENELERKVENSEKDKTVIASDQNSKEDVKEEDDGEEEEEEEETELEGKEGKSEEVSTKKSLEDIEHSKRMESAQKIFAQLALDREDARLKQKGKYALKFDNSLNLDEPTKEDTDVDPVDDASPLSHRSNAPSTHTPQELEDIRKRVRKNHAKRQRSNVKRNVTKLDRKKKQVNAAISAWG